MTKHTKKSEKSGKTLISCLMGKIPYFRVFPLFFGIFGNKKFFLQFCWLIFKWETKFSLGILWPNPISSILLGD